MTVITTNEVHTSLKGETVRIKSLALATVFALSATSLAACGTGSESAPKTTTTTIALTKGKGLCDLAATKKDKKKCNKIGRSIEKGVNDAVKYVDNYSKDVAKQVAKEYKNAEGAVVDAANQVVDFFPKTWPDITDEVILDLIDQAQDEIMDFMEDIEKEIKTAIDDVNRAAQSEINKFKKLTDASPAQAEKVLDSVLNKINTAGWLNALSFTGGLKWIPRLQLEAEVKDGQWNDYKANLGFSLDFFGLKKYYVGMGCLAFWKDMSRDPQFLLNGGCNNPWGITLSADLLMNIMKDLALDTAKDVEALGNQMVAEMKKAVIGDSDGNNPRAFEPMVLSFPLNMLLASATSITGGLKKSVERKTEIRLYFPKFKKSIEISAAMLVPDVALAVKMVNPSWKNEGKFDVRIALYFLNLTAGSLDFGCVQMGDNWNKTPTFTFQGGCDNEWNLGGPEDPITGKQL